MQLTERFKLHLQTDFGPLSPIDKKWLIAVSGGIDSVVLCHLAAAVGIDFVIAHCNFMLRGEESQRDEAFVKSLGDQLQKPVYSIQFDTEDYARHHKVSTQVAARQLRYQWFNQIIRGEWIAEVNTQVAGGENPTQLPVSTVELPRFIVTAHHANDNIETLLMNFFKGTGISGLHGILPYQNNLLRPLLPFKKEALVDYATAYQLQYVEDSSNAGDKYTRNYFRQHIIPLLKEKYPQVEENLLQNIQRFGEAETLYFQAIEQHKKKLVFFKENEVHIPVLKLQKTEPMRSVLYEIIKAYGFVAAQLDDISNLLDNLSGKYVASPTHRIFKNRKWLIISPLQSIVAANIIIEKEDGGVDFAQGHLSIEEVTADEHFTIPTGSHIACLDAKELSYPLLLRQWKQGDYFYPLGMRKKKKLSRFFIDKKLSKADKEKVWVIESAKKIIWVVGQRIDDRFKVTPATKKLLIITQNQ